MSVTLTTFLKNAGLIFNNGKPYRHLKSFTLKHLKDFGLGRRENMEIAVEDELLNFLDYFKRKVESQNNVVHIHHTFTLPVLNILWEMVAG
jgi:methyl farnesoate epoxidase/farnesoate epoxidase